MLFSREKPVFKKELNEKGWRTKEFLWAKWLFDFIHFLLSCSTLFVLTPHLVIWEKYVRTE